ncbi:tail assembly chaperone [Limosilactobacillus oris]|nr:tail assembly chaperone [Limosilactobacillus oris]WHO86578.1 tail assembly chaperone [Limosilactobacillus oris]
MEITINKKDYELNFGVKFVRLMDKKMPIKVNVNGMGEQDFGMALTRVVPGLKTYDTSILSDVIYNALWSAKPRPSQDDVDAFIDDPDTDIEKLFNDVIDAMSKSNSVKLATKNLRA